jgi:predicted Zn-dependent protease
MLATGLTRDGLWLVENGKITKAVKNFRFTESPLFMLNSIEQLGTPVPVFRPTRREGSKLTPAIVPPLKVRDFSFTSTIDAI